MAKLTAEQRIERCHVQLMKHPNFCLFSGLFMIGKVSVSDEVETAVTNGLQVEYGREFVDMLNDKALAFLVLHENMHKAYRHMVVWQGLYKKNANLANMACDFVINLQLHDYDPKGEVIELPTDENGETIGCIDEEFRGMDAHQVFLLLEKKLGSNYGKRKIKVLRGVTVECDDPNADGGGEGEGDGDGDEESDGDNPYGKPMDKHDWEGASSMSEKDVSDNAKEIESALRQGAILAGKMKGNLSRDMQELLTPKIDWKEALRDFIKTSTQGKDQSTWKRLHKRYIGMDIIMPSSYDEKIGSIVIAVDTSGSIGGAELAQFLGEVKSICDEVSPEKIDLLYWDTEVASHETYSNNELAGLIESTKAKGGGGTDPVCVPKYIKKKQLVPECVIMLTDGYINKQKDSDWQLNMPVLWCIKGNPRFDIAVVGKVVHIE
jgi:predicted metal-dependent peptidase